MICLSGDKTAPAVNADFRVDIADLAVLTVSHNGSQFQAFIEPKHLPAFANALHDAAAKLVDHCTLARLEAEEATNKVL